MDTPGFGDSSGRDNQLIAEMMEILDNELGSTNLIVLLIDGNTPRFSSGLYDMLRSVLYCTVLYCTVLDWTGLDWTGLDWTGLERTGTERNGTDRNGTE